MKAEKNKPQDESKTQVIPCINNCEEVLKAKHDYIKSLLEVIEIYEQKEANNKLLQEANEMVEQSYKAVIKAQKRIIILLTILSISLIVSLVINITL